MDQPHYVQHAKKWFVKKKSIFLFYLHNQTFSYTKQTIYEYYKICKICESCMVCGLRLFIASTTIVRFNDISIPFCTNAKQSSWQLQWVIVCKPKVIKFSENELYSRQHLRTPDGWDSNQLEIIRVSSKKVN